jgi:uncharacterized protein
VFSTKKGNYYVYDNETGIVYPITEIQKEILELYRHQYSIEYIKNILEKKYIPKEIDKEIDNIKLISSKYKLFVPQSAPEIHCNIEEVNKKKGIRQLILVVTENCNLRCKYCIYSGHYEMHRTHSKNYMPIEIAKKSVDFYFNYNSEYIETNPQNQLCIGFYGGEPLLNFELIKNIVHYVNAKYNQNDILYTITTNGTLLNDEKIRFLVDNNFSINISLDGSQIEHDRNRVYANNLGTHGDVLENIKKLYKIEKESKKPNKNEFKIMTCFDHKSNLLEVSDFFDNNVYLKNRHARIMKIIPDKTTYCSSDDKNPFIKKLHTQFQQSYEKNKQSFISTFFGPQYTLLFSRDFYKVNPTRGNCIPGSKLVVDYQGNFHMCDKMSNNYPIGNIHTGFNYKIMKQFMNSFYENISNHCKDCNVSRLCMLCFANCEDKSGEFKVDKTICERNKSSLPMNLSNLYSLLEENPNLFNDAI